MGSTRRSFTDEYKEQAVGFVLDDGRAIAEVARNIGVHEMTLGKWVKRMREDRDSALPVDAPLTESERSELARLRGEVRDANATISELQMQVDFAKKVALGSGGRRNAFGQCSSGCRVAQGFPGAGIQFGGNGVEVALGVAG